MSIAAVSEETFDSEVLESDRLVLVDYWADWCAPCRAMGPVLEELDRAFEGRLRICKVNIDENPRLALANRIVSIPTLCLYQDGKVVKRMVGLQEPEEMKEIIRPYLAK